MANKDILFFGVNYIEILNQLLKESFEGKEVTNFSQHNHENGSVFISLMKSDGSSVSVTFSVPVKVLTKIERDKLILQLFDGDPKLSSYKIGNLTGCHQSTAYHVLKKHGRIKGKNK